MKATAINKITGELIELKANGLEEVTESWLLASEMERVAKQLKDSLRDIVPAYIDDKGRTEPHKNYSFRVMSIQRYTYDKAIMRRVLDEDTFDFLLKPDKPSVDKFIKENVVVLGDDSALLRATMIPEGKPYEVIKLEKLG
jgi:hypothetical protein